MQYRCYRGEMRKTALSPLFRGLECLRLATAQALEGLFMAGSPIRGPGGTDTAQQVISKFRALGLAKKYKPNEWTVLAGIVCER